MKTHLSDAWQTNSSANYKLPRYSSGAWARRTALLCLVSALAINAWAAQSGPTDVGGKKSFKVYQGNAYVGALIEAPLALNPADPNYAMALLESVTQVYQQIEASEPPKRMAGVITSG